MSKGIKEESEREARQEEGRVVDRRKGGKQRESASEGTCSIRDEQQGERKVSEN